jgi:hypothetical protein
MESLWLLFLQTFIHSRESNFIDWLQSGAVMHYSRYMEPQNSHICFSPIPARSSCMYAVYSERKWLLWRVIIGEQRKSIMLQGLRFSRWWQWECCLLGCDAMGLLLEPKFQRSVLPPLSGWKESVNTSQKMAFFDSVAVWATWKCQVLPNIWQIC